MPPWTRFLLAAAAMAVAPALAQPDCRALKERRDQRMHQAMQAEITLLQSIRARLCPAQEAQAAAANALAPGHAAGTPLDYSAYIRCRQRAEAHLQRSRPVLYRNTRGFAFYTVEGARLASEADGLQLEHDRRCRPNPG
jgi:hypothetical protein